MTHQVYDPTTNTITTDPEDVARHVVIPGREGTSPQDPPRIIIANDIDDDEAQEHWLWLHPAQALAVGQRLIDLATAALDPQTRGSHRSGLCAREAGAHAGTASAGVSA